MKRDLAASGAVVQPALPDAHETRIVWQPINRWSLRPPDGLPDAAPHR